MSRPCRLCPRFCEVDRDAGERGFCGGGRLLELAAASVHYGEEPPVTGTGGSGTVFVSGCNLRCGFCQNYQISQQGMGTPVVSETFAGIALALQERGAENINIVTGSHHIPALAAALTIARQRGLSLPVLWNSSAYETPAALDLLDGLVDGFLPDLKTLDPALALKFFSAADYPDTACAAIISMLNRRPARVIVRHLALPGYLDSTKMVLQWFARNAAPLGAQLSLMTQYTPVSALPNDPAPRRFLNMKEYETLLAWLEEFGIDDGFYQELEISDRWLPDFRRVNPFSSDLSIPVWHWKQHEIIPPQARHELPLKDRQVGDGIPLPR